MVLSKIDIIIKYISINKYYKHKYTLVRMMSVFLLFNLLNTIFNINKCEALKKQLQDILNKMTQINKKCFHVL